METAANTAKAANKIIKEGIALLPDEAKKDFAASANPNIFVDEAINNAFGAVNGDLEKACMLDAYAVQEANRVVTTLWRLQLLPEDLEKEYRKLPPMTEMADAYNTFVVDRKARMDKVMTDHKAIAEEEKNLDIFKGIVNGISAEESEKKYNEFMKQQQAAMGR